MNIREEVLAHRRVIHGGPFSIGDPPPGLLDFSSSISPLGPPESVRTYLASQAYEIETYPDPESRSLRRRLGRYAQVSESQIAIGNGATEIIHDICRVFLSRNTPVLVQAPTFGEYEAASRINGGRISVHASMSIRDDPGGFADAVPENGLVFLCNPNNPTGDLVTRDGMGVILESARRRSSILVVDECFMEMVAEPAGSIPAMIKRSEGLLVLRSMTKSFGLAGIRVGYILGPRRLVGLLREMQIPWNVSGVAQGAAEAALLDTTHLERARHTIARERAFLTEEISTIQGFDCLDSAANFILVRTRLRPGTIRRRLLRENILVRDCSSFAGLDGNYIRIAVKSRRENERLVEAMRRI